MWGNAKDVAPIYLDGRKFYVTANCVAALRAIRHATRRKTLWVDAICINQSDNIEKGHQVEMMSHIYEKGWVDFLYMGLDEEQIGLATGFLDKWTLLYNRRQPMRPTDIAKVHGKELGVRDWRETMNVFTAGVWQRMWIVQELALASDVIVICGSRRYEWLCLDALAQALLSPLYINRITTEARKGINTVQSVTALMAERQDKRVGQPGRDDILSVWADFGYCRCLHPRDKIFALLGIVHPSKNLGIRPNYQTTVTDSGLFCQVTRNYISQNQDLMILLYCRCSGNDRKSSPARKDLDTLPTWVPNFGSDSKPLIPGFLANRPQWNAGFYIPWLKSSTIILRQDRDESQLSLIGTVVDKLKYVLNISSLIQNDERLESLRVAYFNLARTFPQKYLRGEVFSDLFWRTIAGNQYRKSLHDFAVEVLEDSRRCLKPWRAGLDYILQNGFENATLSPQQFAESRGVISRSMEALLQASLIREHLLDTTQGYTVAFTEMGYCALVLEGSRIGDYVCGLAGGSAPYILRPVEISGDRMVAIFVGLAYIHRLRVDKESVRGNLCTFTLI